MQLVLVAVGQRLDAWMAEGTAEYTRRMPPDWPLRLVEVKAEPRNTGKTPQAMMRAEAERIRAALPTRTPYWVLDERGQAMTSRRLADALVGLRDGQQMPALALVIGGADGLDAELKAQALGSLRLSDFTLPHGLARVVLAEQLYRAVSLIQGHPYHRD